MWQKIINIVIIILLGVLLYLELRPVPKEDYKKSFQEIQVKIDSISNKVEKERMRTDSLVIIKNYYHDTKEILKEQIQNLPLDSAVKLLRKNLIQYEENSNLDINWIDTINITLPGNNN